MSESVSGARATPQRADAVTRRQVMQRAAVAGAVTAAVWVTPSITTARAASAATMDPTSTESTSTETTSTDPTVPPEAESTEQQPTDTPNPNVVSGADVERSPGAVSAATAEPGTPTFTG